ncbi:hypothetical protein [Amycolatopsis silviterrae]|uniref:Translation initiation factor IF-2 n=1 Tax=Amycolatopsis silviterrae TaxID=1656914 RepID=A0ABW5H274_9PSEU
MNDNEHPSPGEPAGQEPTEQFGRTGDLGAASASEGSAGQPGSAAEQPAQPGQPAGQAGHPNPPAQPAEQAAQPGQPPSPAEAAQPGPFAQPSPWGMPLPPPKQGGFRRFIAHRATQLVAVGVLGLAVGGGIVGGVMAATDHHPGRPGTSQHQGGHRFNDGGPGQHHRNDAPDNGPRFGN